MIFNLFNCFVIFLFFISSAINNVYGKTLEPLVVVNTSQPISLITNEVINGVIDSRLITQPYEIVFHDYQFKPSDYKLLKSSDIIFAISKDVERFLEESFKDKNIVYLMDYIEKRDIRNFHSNVNISNSGDIGHIVDKIDDEYIKEVEDGKIIDMHGSTDAHIWLSIQNARNIADAICNKMIILDKENREKYSNNTRNFHKKLDAFLEKNKGYMDKFKNMKYIVMHDSYQYFEDNFNISPPSGCIIDSSHNFVGTKTFMSYINGIRDKEYKCMISDDILSESAEIFKSFAKNFIVEYVDIIGANSIKQDGDLYILILNNLLQAFINCANVEL